MKTLFVLLGPTSVGKTELSLSIAGFLGSPILNADSRQIYCDLPIGTAAPTCSEQACIKHYFVGTHRLEQTYSAALFERDALQQINKLFHEGHDSLLMTGGSMLYLDAVCRGMDNLPTIRPEIREQIQQLLGTEGLPRLFENLCALDKITAQRIDAQNPRRVAHALEVCIQTGRPYSSFLSATKAKRPFRIVKIGLIRPREELFSRISSRVDHMMQLGWIREARAVYPYRHFDSLQTVGYPELFDYLEGKNNWLQTTEKIKRNTRVYAKKQITWFSHDSSIVWFHPDWKEQILLFVKEQLDYN